MLKTYEVSVFRLHSAGENKKVPLSHGNLIPIISSKRKRKAGLVWTVVLTKEIKLRFQISLVQCG